MYSTAIPLRRCATPEHNGERHGSLRGWGCLGVRHTGYCAAPNYSQCVAARPKDIATQVKDNAPEHADSHAHKHYLQQLLGEGVPNLAPASLLHQGSRLIGNALQVGLSQAVEQALDAPQYSISRVVSTPGSCTHRWRDIMACAGVVGQTGSHIDRQDRRRGKGGALAGILQ